MLVAYDLYVQHMKNPDLLITNRFACFGHSLELHIVMSLCMSHIMTTYSKTFLPEFDGSWY